MDNNVNLVMMPLSLHPLETDKNEMKNNEATFSYKIKY